MKSTVDIMRANQIRILNVIYRCKQDSTRHAKLLAMYEFTVAQLETILGKDAHCNEVDQELFSFFSDFYKDVNGVRPRFHMTRADVQAWIARENEPERVAQRDAEWAAEAAWADAMEEDRTNDDDRVVGYFGEKYEQYEVIA